MPEPTDFVVREIPARIADLGFRIAIPRDWNSMELPAEEVDFSSPGNFFPLMLAAAPWAMVVLTVAARPRFEDGSLQDWSLFLLSMQGIRPTSFGHASIGGLKGLAGVGQQEQEGTLLEVRFAFFEYGGRLVHLGLLAPESISAPLEVMWKKALDSFELESPQGQNVPLGAMAGIQPEAVEAAVVEEVAVEEVAVEEAVPAPAAEPVREFTEDDLGRYAKGDDLATLDPENPTNARLRDQGVGFVPNLLGVDLEAKTAKLGAGAIRAVIGVALGWHVIDDGKRTIVLDPEGKIQISLNVIAMEGRSIDQILDEIEAEAVQSYSSPELLRLQDGGIWGLAVRNIAVNDEPVEQLHMLTRWAAETGVLRARVTADAERMRFAANYADLILKSADYGDQSS